MHPESSDSRQWLSDIRAACHEGNEGRAWDLARQAVSDTRRNPKVLEVAGLVAYDQELWKPACHLLQEAMCQICLSVASRVALCGLWFRFDKMELLEGELEFLVENIDEVPCQLLPELSCICSSCGRDDLGLEVCRVAFCRHPDDDQAVFGFGTFLKRLGFPCELVCNVIEKAVQMNPSCDLYRIHLIRELVKLDLWPKAYSVACDLNLGSLRLIACHKVLGLLKRIFHQFSDSDRLGQLISSAEGSN